MPARGLSLRLFLTCWLVYCLHLATDFSREHFLVVSIVDRHTFTLDPYEGMHSDIFHFQDGHAYHGANPGISMLGAVPYFLLKPAVDLVVNRELAARRAAHDTSAVYTDPRPARQEFYRRARANGWDVRFGLINLITMIFCMAPIAAFGAVVVQRTLQGAGLTAGLSLFGALLYAFGTPVFFRAAYLNQNLAVAVFAFLAFALLWDPGNWSRMGRERRLFLAGLAGGMALLCDYTGAVLLGLLGLYTLLRGWQEGGIRGGIRDSLRFSLGALGPMVVLWWYQWVCFGDAFLPPQNHMPASQNLSTLGWKGVTGPQADLFLMLLFDPRFGLFVTGPVLALGFLAPWWLARRRSFIPGRELAFLLIIPAFLIIFFSSVQYTRLQYIHGIRYLIPVVPFLMVAALVVLMRLPRWLAGLIALGSFALSWSLAMSRLEEQQTSIVEGLKTVWLGGFRLPALTTLSRMSAQYAPELAGGVSPLPAFLIVGVLIYLIWKTEWPVRSLLEDPEGQ
jgi:hypothetical protein